MIPLFCIADPVLRTVSRVFWVIKSPRSLFNMADFIRSLFLQENNSTSFSLKLTTFRYLFYASVFFLKVTPFVLNSKEFHKFSTIGKKSHLNKGYLPCTPSSPPLIQKSVIPRDSANEKAVFICHKIHTKLFLYVYTLYLQSSLL